MPAPLPAVSGIIAVVVHGPACSPLPEVLWAAGLRPLAGTEGPTIWVPSSVAGKERRP